jgi:hypothetical protein
MGSFSRCAFAPPRHSKSSRTSPARVLPNLALQLTEGTASGCVAGEPRFPSASSRLEGRISAAELPR